MKTPLLPTQEDDILTMRTGMEVPNFSEPGTGKTLTTVGFIEAMKYDVGLIICPVIALSMWKEVLEYELDCKAQIVHDGKMKLDKQSNFFVMSYGIAANRQHELMSMPNDIIVCDESQYLKSSDALRTQAIFGPDCNGEDGLYESCDQLICLTGTPIERYADDLWSQLRATQPEALARHGALSLADFQRQFCVMEEKSYAGGAVTKRVSTRNQNEKKLNRMLYEDIGVIRRVMSDVTSYMPPVMQRTISVKPALSPEYIKAMATLPRNFAELVESGDAHIATARRLVGIAKVPDGAEYIIEEAKRDKLLVGFWHIGVGQLLTNKLRSVGLNVEMIAGDVSGGQRDDIKRRFLKGDIDVIVGQIAAMGVAMDGLQKACHRVIMFEDEFAPSKVEQFFKRVWRMGQTSPVLVEYIKALDDPIDDAVARLRERKAAGAGMILSQG